MGLFAETDRASVVPTPPVPPEGVFKGWVPSAYLDEIAPPPRATPAAWLVPAADFREEEECWPALTPAIGDRVSFHGLTTYPDLVVRIEDAQVCTIVEGVVPAGDGLTFCEPGDTDTMADTLDDFARAMVDFDPGRVGETVTVGVYAWREAVFVHRDGAFHPVAAGEP